VLRETVTDSARCLDDLTAGQRRVLTLRAGVGAGPPRSRGGVAKRLNISERRVVRLERTGLRRLRTLAKGGGCAAAAQTQTQTAGTVAPFAASEISTPSSSGGGTSGGERASDGGGGSDENRGGTDTPGKSGRNGGIAGVTQTNLPGSVDLTIPLLLLLLAAAAAATFHVLRRRATPASVTGDTEQPPEPSRPTWVPWRRSTMDGPRWTAAPPPSGDEAAGWSTAPGTEPEPKPEPQYDDEWTPPTPRRRVH
jgi:hypothetical protein